MNDSRPRNNNGQFAPDEMSGVDANTTSAAYNPQIIEARKAALAEKLRRAVGIRRGVEESVPQEQRVLSRFDHGGHGEHGGVREFSILNKISNLTGMAQIKAGREALDLTKTNRWLRDAYRADAVKQNKFPYRDSDLQYKIESGMRHRAIARGTDAKYDVRRARKLINEGVRRRNISIGVGAGVVGAGAGAGYLATREKDLSAKLRLRELARQAAYDPYAVQAQPAEPGQAGRDFRNAALGIGALGAGGGVAYAGFRGAQAAKSAQVLTDDALKTSGEARKAARSARVAAARVNRAGKWAKTQLTTFPTFKKVASKIFEEDLQGLKELAAKSVENLKSRLKELAAKSEEKRSGVGRAALIGGGVLAGGLVGMRTLPRLLPKGRLVQEGESLLGKVVYNNQGLTTPAEIIHLPNGRSLRGVLRKNREATGLKGTLSRAALKADEFLGVPQRHYGVGVGSGRIAEVSKSRGRKIVDQGEFGKKVYIDNDGKVLRERGVPQRAEGRAGTMNDAEVEAFNKRYEASQADKRWDRKSVCAAGANNCEAYARGIGTGKAVSRQVQAMRVGAMAGAVAGGGGATWLTRRKDSQ